MDDDVIEAIVRAGGARAHAFFVARRLGAAYLPPGDHSSIRARVAAALTVAQSRGKYKEIISDAHEIFLSDEVTNSLPKENAMPGGTLRRKTRSRLFVSHASADKELANRLVELLRLGTDLSRRDVLCTSLEGMKIPTGTPNYIEYLRLELSNARLVLPLLTPAYFESSMCMVELGGLWALDDLNRFPILVPPIGYPDLEKVLGKIQSARIDKGSDLSSLHDEIVRIFNIDHDTPMWNEQQSGFLNELPDILSRLQPATVVSASEHAATGAALRKEKAAHRATKVKLKTVTTERDRIAKLKDAAEVAAILIPDDEMEHFNQLADNSQRRLADFTSAVREALYLHVGMDELLTTNAFQDHDKFDEANEAMQQDELYWDPNYEAYGPNEADKSVKTAIEAVNELFDYKWSEELKEDWSSQNRGKEFKRSSKAVWSALGFL